MWCGGDVPHTLILCTLSLACSAGCAVPVPWAEWFGALDSCFIFPVIFCWYLPTFCRTRGRWSLGDFSKNEAVYLHVSLLGAYRGWFYPKRLARSCLCVVVMRGGALVKLCILAHCRTFPMPVICIERLYRSNWCVNISIPCYCYYYLLSSLH